MIELDVNFDAIIDRANSHSIKWGRTNRDGVISFSTADMDFKSPPCVRDALIEKAESGIYAYEHKTDIYYQSVIDWFSERYQWKISSEWMTNCPGMWAMLSLCLRAYTQPGDNVLLHAPRFHPAISVIEGADRNAVTQALSFDGVKYSFDLNAFEDKIIKESIKLFFLVNPHNPTGLLFNKSELSGIADVCYRHDVLVVSDEINSYLTYDDAVFIPYGSVSTASRLNSVTLTSPSKAFNLQGLTYAIGIIPDREKWDKLEKVRSGMDFDFATNIFSIAATTAAYQSGAKWLSSLNAYLQSNLDYMDTFFRDNLPHVKLIRPSGGYIAWLDFRSLQLHPNELRKIILEQARLDLTWGETFGKEGEGFERINFACPRETLRIGLERLRSTFS